MVMQLTQPAACGVTLVTAVVAERQNGINAGFFSGIEEEWRKRVQGYIDATGSPDVVSPWADVAYKKKSFLNLYLAPAAGSAQGTLLKTLRDDHELTLCPMCGEPGTPNTLDHYLPKGRYPEFCITPLNLFPACDKCQREKGEKTGDATAPRFFLHPYFDLFVAEQVVALSIQPPYDAPTFTLTPAPSLTADQTILVEAHVRELAIHQRYGRYFREQHRRLLRLVGKARESGQDVPSTIELFRFNAASPCPNGWDHVFFAAVASDPEIMDYLENAVLPTYL